MSVSYELTGRVKLVQEPQTFGSGFTKRELVVVVEDGKYPQEINIEFVQDSVGLLDDVRAGDEVTIGFNLRGREYNGRYFNSLQGWKLHSESSRGTERAPIEATPGKPIGAPDEYEDDIPF